MKTPHKKKTNKTTKLKPNKKFMSTHKLKAKQKANTTVEYKQNCGVGYMSEHETCSGIFDITK